MRQLENGKLGYLCIEIKFWILHKKRYFEFALQKIKMQNTLVEFIRDRDLRDNRNDNESLTERTRKKFNFDQRDKLGA